MGANWKMRQKFISYIVLLLMICNVLTIGHPDVFSVYGNETANGTFNPPSVAEAVYGVEAAFVEIIGPEKNNINTRTPSAYSEEAIAFEVAIKDADGNIIEGITEGITWRYKSSTSSMSFTEDATTVTENGGRTIEIIPENLTINKNFNLSFIQVTAEYEGIESEGRICVIAASKGLRTDKETVQPGGEITAILETLGDIVGNQAKITLKKDGGTVNAVPAQEVTIIADGDDGKVEATFTIPADLEEGTYLLEAIAVGPPVPMGKVEFEVAAFNKVASVEIIGPEKNNINTRTPSAYSEEAIAFEAAIKDVDGNIIEGITEGITWRYKSSTSSMSFTEDATTVTENGRRTIEIIPENLTINKNFNLSFIQVTAEYEGIESEGRICVIAASKGLRTDKETVQPGGEITAILETLGDIVGNHAKITLKKDGSAVTAVPAQEVTIIADGDDGKAEATFTIPTDLEVGKYLLEAIAVGPPTPMGKVEFEIATFNENGYVTVRVADEVSRLPDQIDSLAKAYRQPFGTILSPTEIAITDGMTMRDALEVALATKGISVYGAPNYVSGIGPVISEDGSRTVDSLSEFDGGPASGWMVTLNDWFINAGANSFVVTDGDVVEFIYTCNVGVDLGADFDNTDQTLKDISVSAGFLSPAFVPSVKNYNLILQAETQVSIQPTATNKSNKVIIESKGSIYRPTDVITVTDEQIITVTCGENIYQITVQIPQGDQESADVVIALINDLPPLNNLVLADKEAVMNARIAYDQLTVVQQGMVTNYAKLQATEERIAQLEAESKETVEITNILIKKRLSTAAGKEDDYTQDLTKGELAAITGHIDLSSCNITNSDMAVMQYLIGVSSIDLSFNPNITADVVNKDTFDWTTPKSLNFTGCTGIEAINNNAFGSITPSWEEPDGAYKLVNIILPSSVKSIGDNAFRECLYLESITIPEGVKTIGDHVFQDCIALIGIVLPDSITSIGMFNFSGCSNLTSVTLPQGITSLPQRTFRNCTSLRSIELPNSITQIGAYAFSNTGIETIDLPEKLTRIEDFCFRDSTSLTSIVIPDSVTTLGTGIFINCASLSSVTLPQAANAYSIPSSMFSSCTSLIKIAIPEMVNSIGSNVFRNCNNLAVLDLRGTQFIEKILNWSVPDATIVLVGNDAQLSPSFSFISMDDGENLIIDTAIPEEKNVIWGSSNPQVAIVENGVVTGIDAGTAFIYAKTDDDSYSGVCEVRVSSSKNAFLQELSVPGVTFKEKFERDTTTYSAEVNNVSSVVVTGVAEDGRANIKVNGIEVIDDEPTIPIDLKAGENRITIEVTAVDGVTSKIYTIILQVVNDTLLEFMPAPGQFINKNGWGLVGDEYKAWTHDLGPDPGYGTPEYGVSLGAFGGYTVFKFDAPIENNPNNPYGVDFIIYGNAFSGNEEPGSVMVMQDENGNGLPDGTWYALAGSEHYEDSTIWDYTVTYTNPDLSFSGSRDVPWIDNYGGSGVVKSNPYHSQPYYPNPANYPSANFSAQEMSLSGVKITTRTPSFGYFDVHGNGSAPYGVPSNPYSKSTTGDPMDISWAVDEDGNPVHLDKIDFVKAYTSVIMDAGSFGEVSAEILGIHRVSPSAGISNTLDLRGITLVGSNNELDIPLEEGKYSYKDLKINEDEITLKVYGDAANIYVNNEKLTKEQSSEAISLNQEERIVRIIVQDSKDTPKIYYLNITKGNPTTDEPQEELLKKVQEANAKIVNYVQDCEYMSDWMVVGLGATGKTVPTSYLEEMIAEVEICFKENINTNKERVTDHERRTLAFGAAGMNPRNIGGHDLVERIYNFYIPDLSRDITFQGLNGVIYALIALDSKGYEIPTDARYDREYLINYLLNKQNNDGGWALSAGAKSDVDITAMTLTSLAPYHDRENVLAAVNRGTAWLSQNQLEDGGYASWGTANSESISQTIIALCANGIDPVSEEFIKNGNNMLDALLAFQNEDGAILHVMDGSGDIGMATEQGYHGLLAYEKFMRNNGAYNQGRTSLFYFGADGHDDQVPPVIDTSLSDMTINGSILNFTVQAVDEVDGGVIPFVRLNGQLISGKNGTYSVTLTQEKNIISVIATDVAGNIAEKSFTITYIPREQELPSGKQPVVVIPDDNDDYKMPVKAEDGDKEITIQIPANKNSKVMVELPANTSLPKIEAVKGEVSVVLPQGTQVISGDTSAVELITTQNDDAYIIEQINKVLPTGKTTDNLFQAVIMGGNTRVEFSEFITLTFSGMKGKEAAFIQDGQAQLIERFANDAEGLDSGHKEYAYDSGNDLIIKTKHFTDFAAFTTKNTETSGGGENNSEVTVSVDKHTINKGYVLRPTSVELRTGDTVWTVLKRELDSWGIKYEYTFSQKYNSVYVQSIAGDGEFDHGEGSGWMYNVNGWYPNYGASRYTLKKGDVVQWRYTTNLGEDLGEDISKWEGSGGRSGSGGTSATPEKPLEEIPEIDGQVKIDLEGQETARIVPQALLDLKDKQSLIIIKDEVQVEVPVVNLKTDSFKKLAEEKDAQLEVAVKELTDVLKRQVLTKAKEGEASGIFDIGGKIYDISLEVVTKDDEDKETRTKLTDYSEPIKITMDLSKLNISKEDIVQLTAVRYEVDKEGNIKAVKLGGKYDPEIKQMTFYTSSLSYYGVAKAQDLAKINLVINRLNAQVNGTSLALDQPAVIIDNRTMVPLRFIAEAMEAEVEWNDEERKIIITDQGKILSIYVDQAYPGLDTPPSIIKGRTMVPIRYIAENLGAYVLWHPDSQQVDIVK